MSEPTPPTPQHKARIIDGKAVAEEVRSEIAAKVKSIRAANPDAPQPCLAVVIVGTRKDSQTYVRLKHKAAEECGFRSVQVELPEDITQEALDAQVQQLNGDAAVHGILVQLPLPKHIDEPQTLELISPAKDVDGLHPTNVGLLNTRGKEPHHYPCTPMGCIELLKRHTAIDGKRACVIGRSNIVGLPAAQLLLQNNATVTICHSRTADIAAAVKECDIVIAACGQPELVRGSWLKPGAVVIDVGTNPVTDESKKAGFRLVGDVNFAEAVEVASAITPVPGGVGPMTIAMLLTNATRSYARSVGAL